MWYKIKTAEVSFEHVFKFEFPTCYVRRVSVSGYDKSPSALAEDSDQ